MKLLFLVAFLAIPNLYAEEDYGKLFYVEEDIPQRDWSISLGYSSIIDNNLIDANSMTLHVQKEMNRFLRLGFMFREYSANDSEVTTTLRESTGAIIESNKPTRSFYGTLSTSPFVMNLNFYNTKYLKAYMDLDTALGLTSYEEGNINNRATVVSGLLGVGIRFYFSQDIYSKLSFQRVSDDLFKGERFNYNQLFLNFGYDL